MQTNNSSKNIELGFGKLLNEINQHFSFIQEFNPGLIERETQKIEDKTYRTDVMFDYHLNMARFHNDKLDVENLSKFINKKHKAFFVISSNVYWCVNFSTSSMPLIVRLTKTFTIIFAYTLFYFACFHI
jgi:hypothetical protein